MTPKNLLLLTYYFPPCAASGTYRALGFARYLPRNGWNVSVVAPPTVKWEPTDPGLVQNVPADTRITHVPFPDTFAARQLSRAIPYEVWLPSAWRAVKRLVEEKRPDAIYTTSPPGCINYLGLLAKRRYGLPWVACFRDPWISTAFMYYRNDFFKLIETRVELATLRLADRILINTPASLQALQAAHPAYADKMVLLTNGFDPGLLPPSSEAPDRERSGPLTLLHAGELYLGRNPTALLDALKDLRERPEPGVPHMRLTLLGRDSDGIAGTRMAAEPSLAAIIEIKPQVPYTEALQAMMHADILLLIPSPTAKTAIPAKVYEYLGAGKPVLALAHPGTGAEWVLKTAGITHRVASPGDGAGIRQALVELAGEIVSGRARSSDPGKVKVFTREHTAQLLAGHLDACCVTPRSSG